MHQITLHLWDEVAAFEEMRTMRKLQPFSVDPGLLSQSVLTLSSLPAFNHLDCQTMEKRLKHMNWKGEETQCIQNKTVVYKLSKCFWNQNTAQQLPPQSLLSGSIGSSPVQVSQPSRSVYTAILCRSSGKANHQIKVRLTAANGIFERCKL